MSDKEHNVFFQIVFAAPIETQDKNKGVIRVAKKDIPPSVLGVVSSRGDFSICMGDQKITFEFLGTRSHDIEVIGDYSLLERIQTAYNIAQDVSASLRYEDNKNALLYPLHIQSLLIFDHLCATLMSHKKAL